MGDDEITGIYELLDAIEAVIKAADPAKREALARTSTPIPRTSLRTSFGPSACKRRRSCTT
jgi:hypothetical protein